MASGLGKTVTVALDIKNWLKEHRGRVLYLCHQNDILYQAKATIQAVLGSSSTFGFFHGTEKNLRGVDCLFASFQTMERSLDFFDPEEFSYVAVDESHHSQADTYRSVVEYFRPRFLLAVTATPNRRDHRNIRELYGEEVYFLPLDEALARELVCPVDYRLMSEEIDLDEIIRQEAKDRLSIKALNRHIFLPRRDEEIAAIIGKHSGECTDPKIIVFCPSIEYCGRLTTLMPGSLPLHARIAQKERAVRLELFRQGIINAVLTVDAFNEGVDIPRANVVVFLRSTASSTVFLQQLGRGLRKADGKEKVVVLDFVANCERINMVYDLWEAAMEGFERVRGNQEKGTITAPQATPMTLNVNHPGFRERIVKVREILERLHPKMISEVPELLAEYAEENLLPPDKVRAETHKTLWWRCSSCRHKWRATGRSRFDNNAGCPVCVRKIAAVPNNLTITHPRLAAEYSNRNRTPARQVLAETGNKLWWTCPKGHTWQATGSSRVSSDPGCPICAGRMTITLRSQKCPTCGCWFAAHKFHKGTGCPSCAKKRVRPA